MRGEWLSVALCVLCVRADLGTAAPAPALIDVSSKWLEEFRRHLLQDSYDYGPPPAGPGSTHARRDGNNKVVADDMAPRENGISRQDLVGASREDGISTRDLAGASREDGISTRDLAGASREDGISTRDLAGASREDGISTRDLAGASREDGISTRDLAGASREDGISTRDLAGASREDGISTRDLAGASREDGISTRDLAGASREDGISTRDLAGGVGAPPRPRKSSLTEGERDPRRKVFLDTIYELEDEFKPMYLPKDQTDAMNQGKDVFFNGRRKNEDIDERPPYVEENGVKQYRVKMDAKQKPRNKFDDGLPWLVSVGRELGTTGDRQNRNKESEDRQHQNYNYTTLPDGQASSVYRNDSYEGNGLHYGDSLNVTQQGDNLKQYQGYENENRVQFRAYDQQNAEQLYQEDRSTSTEDSASDVNGDGVEDTRELDNSEDKQEDVKSLYIKESRRGAGGGGGGGYGERFAERRDKELLADGVDSTGPQSADE